MAVSVLTTAIHDYIGDDLQRSCFKRSLAKQKLTESVKFVEEFREFD